ncbi:hypothetical protein OPT61_g7145 [Boeremia exigua]|uniref:Uncharacterized protein n=1 Tax=Boeremia exigua TaxID=749465 RepID=A0ACC2I3Z7_9PLEO|nr:hypothetical protein OPT61_g7145 [Boeremia exigua]
MESVDGMIVSRNKRMKFDDIIHIEAGSGENLRSFSVHATCLTSRSPFFEKALSGAWREAKDRTVKFPENKSDIVELYLQCVYDRPLDVEPDPVPENYAGHEERLQLAELYVFAEQVQDVRAKNMAVKAFMSSVWKPRKGGRRWPPGPATINVIYEGTMPGSSMRRLCVDIFARGLIFGNIKYDNPPTEFLAEIIKEMFNLLISGTTKKLTRECNAEPYLETEPNKDG